MIDDPFRRFLPTVSQPVTRLYARLGLTPNAVSWIGFAVAAAAAVTVALDWRLVAVALWWSGRLLDGTDGIYARQYGGATDFGAYLDIVLDMAAYSLMILAFAVVHPELHAEWMIIVFLYVLCIASALALGTQEAKRKITPRDDRGLRLGAGLAEGGETGIAYTSFLLLPQHVHWLAWVWIAILATTVVARTILARRILAEPGQ